ncbi:MAG: hypothetical protein V1922_04605 [bacterium]
MPLIHISSGPREAPHSIPQILPLNNPLLVDQFRQAFHVPQAKSITGSQIDNTSHRRRLAFFEEAIIPVIPPGKAGFHVPLREELVIPITPDATGIEPGQARLFNCEGGRYGFQLDFKKDKLPSILFTSGKHSAPSKLIADLVRIAELPAELLNEVMKGKNVVVVTYFDGSRQGTGMICLKQTDDHIEASEIETAFLDRSWKIVDREQDAALQEADIISLQK